MTLNEFVKKGNCMLSNDCSAWCCQVLGINERMLREMELEDIYKISGAGEYAKRIIERWIKENS